MRLRKIQDDQASGSIVAALDIGSSKVCCLIAAVTPTASALHEVRGGDAGVPWKIIALGVGLQRSRGIEAGAVVDPAAARNAVRLAVSQAEQMARLELRSLHIGVGCGAPRSRTFHACIDLTAGAVEAKDIAAIDDGAKAFACRGGGQLLALERLGYRLDAGGRVLNPVGMAGRQLHADHHAVLADEGALQNLAALVEACHLEVAGHAPAAMASALAATSMQERQRGVTCIDMGAGLTQMAAFMDGNLVHIDQIPAGGQQITDDIARALSVPLAEAERIKTLYAMLAPSASVDGLYTGFPFAGTVGGGLDGLARESVARIVRGHSAGLMSELVRRLENSGVVDRVGAQLVLTGGASQVPGLAEFASMITGRSVRTSAPGPMRGWGATVSSAAFSCLIGLAAAAADPEAWGGGTQGAEVEPRGYLGRMERWLRESF